MAEVVEVESQSAGKGSLGFKISGLNGVRYTSAKWVDSLDRGQGNLFSSLGQWIPCRKTEDKGEWVFKSGDYVKARLDDGSVWEGRISDMNFDISRIANLIVRRR